MPFPIDFSAEATPSTSPPRRGSCPTSFMLRHQNTPFPSAYRWAGYRSLAQSTIPARTLRRPFDAGSSTRETDMALTGEVLLHAGPTRAYEPVDAPLSAVTCCTADPMPSFGVDGARADPDAARATRRALLAAAATTNASCSAPISPAPPLAAFSRPTRATTSRRNPTTDIPPPSGLCSSSNSRPDLRRRRPVRCHHHAVGGSPIPRTGRELPKL